MPVGTGTRRLSGIDGFMDGQETDLKGLGKHRFPIAVYVCLHTKEIVGYGPRIKPLSTACARPAFMSLKQKNREMSSSLGASDCHPPQWMRMKGRLKSDIRDRFDHYLGHKMEGFKHVECV